jgi:Protein of unknown function (DUF1616)
MPGSESLLEGVRFLGAAALVLWLPGYALTAALFQRDALGGIERIVITLGSSISIVIVIGLAISVVGLQLTAVTWAAGLLATTLILGASAWRRPGHRSAISRPAGKLTMRGRDPVLFGAAGVLLFVAIGVARVGAEQQPQATSTEVSMVSTSDDGVHLAVRNEEAGQMTYRIVLRSPEAVIADWPMVQLGRGQGWDTEIKLPVGQRTGVELVVYRADMPDKIYRRVAFGPAPSGT